MVPRQITPIDRVPLVGGVLCLDFVNTTGAREADEPRERLLSYRDLAVFCGRTKLLGPTRVDALRREAQGRPAAARKALGRAIAVREALYRIFRAVAVGGPVAEADLGVFNAALTEAARQRRLIWVGGKPRWIWADRPADLAAMLGPILDSAAELLRSPDLACVKQCGECDWLFLDCTKNRGRRWCKTMCGDRVKARRYYRRRRAAGKRTRES